MATSGTTAYSRTAAEIITAALEAIGVYIVSPESYETPENIASTALALLSVSNPTSAQTTTATTALSHLGEAWATYGLSKSGTDYPYNWVEALEYRTAINLAGRFGRAKHIQELKPIANEALASARWSTQRTDGLSTLNMLAKSWHCYGLRPWAAGTASQQLTASTASYTVGPSQTIDMVFPTNIPYAYIRDSSGNDIPLTRYMKDDYLAVSDKDVEGTPTAYYYEEGRSTGTIYLWPVPDTSYSATGGWTLYFDYSRQAEDYSVTTNDVEFPNEWFDALKFNLSVRFAPQYEKPLPQEIQVLAAQALNLVKGSGHEDGVIRFVPRLR